MREIILDLICDCLCFIIIKMEKAGTLLISFLTPRSNRGTIMSKAENYTNEQTVALVTAYDEARDNGTEADRDAVVGRFAAEFGKSVQSIRSKLSRETEYVAKTVAKAEKVVSKSDLADQIADEIGATSDQVESLVKANKNVLERILFALIEDRVDNPTDEELETS